MFYKYNYNPKEKEFIKDNPLEFALVLAEKFKDFPDYSLGFLKAKNKNGEEKILKPIIYNTKSLTYLTKDGERALSKYFITSISKNNPEFTDFSLIASDISHLKPNTIIQEKMKDLLADFFNLKVKKEIMDKNGCKYNIKIVNNADDSIGASLIVETLFLYDEDKKIGYLNAKYTKKDFMEKIYDDTNCAEAKRDKLFVDVAVIDYSKIENEYQNKGLGYVMYFHMAQHLKSEGIKFRSSTIQSPLAQRLWNGINKNWGEYTNQNKIDNKNCFFLSMTKDLELYFEDNTPKIKKIKIN